MNAKEKIKDIEGRRDHMIDFIISKISMTGSHCFENIKVSCDDLKTLYFTIKELKEIDVPETAEDDTLFDIDSLIDKSNKSDTFSPMGATIYQLQTKLLAKIDTIKNLTGATKLITNGNIASVLQDMVGYMLNPSNIGSIKTSTTTPFPMGQIGTLHIYVDANQRWDDNRVVFFKNDEEVFAIKIIDTKSVML